MNVAQDSLDLRRTLVEVRELLNDAPDKPDASETLKDIQRIASTYDPDKP
jgi:hypothetical protein